MITVLPPDTDVTTPDDGPMVATPVLPLLHVPPAVALLSVVVLPLHRVSVPVIGVVVLTVIVVVVVHPAAEV